MMGYAKEQTVTITMTESEAKMAVDAIESPDFPNALALEVQRRIRHAVSDLKKTKRVDGSRRNKRNGEPVKIGKFQPSDWKEEIGFPVPLHPNKRNLERIAAFFKPISDNEPQTTGGKIRKNRRLRLMGLMLAAPVMYDALRMAEGMIKAGNDPNQGARGIWADLVSTLRGVQMVADGIPIEVD